MLEKSYNETPLNQAPSGPDIMFGHKGLKGVIYIGNSRIGTTVHVQYRGDFCI